MKRSGEIAVATTIALMHEHLARPLRLNELAEAAHLSPFHFDRVFRAQTGLPAVAFASALRIDAAKRLLVTQQTSVTDACFALGYDSLGSFVSRFSRSVGVSPGALRICAARDDGAPVAQPAEERIRRAAGAFCIDGAIGGDVLPDTVVWVGAFARGIPDGPPLGGTVIRGGGPFRIEALTPGTYHILALGLPSATSLRGYLALDACARVGKGGAVAVGPAGPAGPPAFIRIALAPPVPTDPPILVALPLLAPGSARTT